MGPRAKQLKGGFRVRCGQYRSTDSIHLPLKEQFPSAGDYYSTLLHEVGHWTGHATRLNRDLSDPFGSIAYAREELRAEIASMIIGSELGIGYDPGQHAAYAASWIQILENQPLEIFGGRLTAKKYTHSRRGRLRAALETCGKQWTCYWICY